MNRRTFILALGALVAGCGGGGGSKSPGTVAVVPSPQPSAPGPQPEENSPAFGSVSYEDGYYVVRDSNATVRVRVGLDSLEGSHVVEPERVTVHYASGGSVVIGRF